jgi:hypothetical protein
MLAVADKEDRIAALASWVQAAGLIPERLIPTEAAAIIGSASHALAPNSTKDEVRAVLWFGEHVSVLAAASGGRLLFVRTIGASVESLIDALCRPIRPKGDIG